MKFKDIFNNAIGVFIILALIPVCMILSFIGLPYVIFDLLRRLFYLVFPCFKPIEPKDEGESRSYMYEKNGKKYHVWQYRHPGDEEFTEVSVRVEDESGNVTEIIHT